MEPQTTPAKKKKILPIIFILIILAAATYGVNKYIYAQHHVETDDAQVDGDISPVLSRVSGYVKSIRFEDNQPVKKGDTLLIIDESDLQIKVNQAEAALENAQAALSVAMATADVATGGVNVSESGVDAAMIRQGRAAQDFKRFTNLIGSEATTQQKFDAAKADKESADAALTMAKNQAIVSRQQSASVLKQVAVAQSIIKQRQADLDFAKLQLAYTVITAPATGLASKKNVQNGQLINAGSPLCAIVSNDAFFVVANFKETQLEKMKVDQPVKVTVDAFPDHPFEGKVYRFSAATGAKFSLLPPDNATGNFVKVIQRVPVKIRIEGDRDSLQLLRPGMSVKVAVAID
ncbi:HlyD family secretion protein [soil metagenome]